MVCRRRRGFTLIELLVVIAIIAILAAMLFPVFARARESARKIQCLSNVKNISTAVQMYFVDYDKFPPAETRAEVNAWFEDCGGDTSPGCCSTQANPYLRWAVIFDEYVRNRDVWRCPSAKLPGYPASIIPDPDWFRAFSDPATQYGACCNTWPVGWGGTATDSDQNGACQAPGDSTGAVEFGLGIYEYSRGQSTSTVANVSQHIVVADACNELWWGYPSQIAYPDICRAEWGRVVDGGCGADWANCSWTADCAVDSNAINDFWTDAEMRKQYARHLGGSNIGFMDGHAAWWPADAIIAGVGTIHDPHPELSGASCQCLPESMQ